MPFLPIIIEENNKQFSKRGKAIRKIRQFWNTMVKSFTRCWKFSKYYEANLR